MKKGVRPLKFVKKLVSYERGVKIESHTSRISRPRYANGYFFLALVLVHV